MQREVRLEVAETYQKIIPIAAANVVFLKTEKLNMPIGLLVSAYNLSRSPIKVLSNLVRRTRC